MTSAAETGIERKRARFEATAVPFTPAVYNAALRLTRSREDAGDLTQETYLRAYRTFDRFREGTNCKAWLLTILYSIFVNRYRKAQRDPPLVALEQMEERFRLAAMNLRDAESRAMGEAHLRENSEEVDRALGELPETFRSVVLLVDLEELSYEEAAAVLACPVGTVRSRLFRARKMLFVRLREYARQQGYLDTSKRRE